MKRIIALCAAVLAAVCSPVGAATLGEALNATNLTWTTGGSAAWFAQSTTTHDGLWAAQSGAISHSQETWIQTTVTGPGPLSFWWKVSSEPGYDYLEFNINGVLQATRISGEVGWQVQNYTLGTGTQVLRWRYMKDGSAVSGQDSGWVDQVSFTSSSGPPVILAQPASRTNNAGTTATFSVVAGGSVPLSYQWRKDGVPVVDGGKISGARTEVLSLTNVLGGDAGGYSLVVTNGLGSVTSVVARLTMVDPVITAQPVSENRQLGQSVTFSVTVAGTAPFGYQWWKDGLALAGGTGASLTLTNLQASDAGNYRVVVSNQYGSVTSAVALLSTSLAGPPNLLLKRLNNVFLGTRPALADDGRFYAAGRISGTVNGVMAFDSTSLTVVWGPIKPCSSWFAGAGVSVGANGLIYGVGDWNECGDGRLVALNSSGTILWQYVNASDHPRQAPALDDSRARVCFGSSAITAIDYNSHAVRWASTGGYYIGGLGIALDVSGNLFVGTSGGAYGDTKVLSFTTSGALRWARTLYGEYQAYVVAVPNPTTLLLRGTNGLLAWNSATGTDAWQSANLWGPVTDTAGNLYAAGATNVVSLTASGQERWRRTLPGGGAIAFIDGTGLLYVQGDRTLSALRIADGSTAWQFSADNPLAVPAALNLRGQIFLSDSAGTGYLLDTVLDYAPSTWPVAYYGNRRHTQKSGDLLPLYLPPAILAQPQDQSGFLGQAATFTVSATTSTPPLSYRWYFNTNTFIANGTNASLTLTNLQVANAGKYSVVVSNPYGSVTSRVANLTVLVPLQFLTQPQSQTVLPGTNVLFSVTVTGTPPLSFQWRGNGTNLADGGRISGARTNSLSVTNVQGQDVGFYSAVVSNPWGSVTSTPAMLRLLSVERLTLAVSNQSPARFDFTNAAWVEVTLTAPFPNALIFYTLDGSAPSAASDFYSGPLLVSNTVVVRALAYNPVDFASVEMAPAAVNFWTAYHLFATAPAGGAVVLEPAGGFYVSNTVVTLTALPAAGWEFLSWTGDASGTASNLSLVMNRDKMVTAQFGRIPTFTLAVTTVGSGTVSGNTQSNYLRGTTVNLSAAPAAGWEFLSWTGDASGTASNVSVVMDRNKSVTAQFALIPRYTLTATTVGSGAVSGNTQSNYLRGTTVNLSAAPAAGWEFLSWSGDASGTASNLSLVMNTNKRVTAQFGRTLFTLTVTTVGGGAVSGNTQSNYFRGTTVNLRAEPQPGWYLQSWSGDAAGTARNVSVVMNWDKSVAARFAPLTLLAVTAGGGTITANPASNYVQDSTVVLNAQPHSGWTFLTWMGDASGTNPQASVTMDRPQEVQAVFGTACNTTVLGQGAVVRNFGTGLVPFGGVVRLTAVPQPGYYLGLWGNAASSVVNPLDFTVTNANPTVGAFFLPLGANQATLTVLEQGAGVVAREPEANAYTKGQAVRLLAQPFPGQAFLGWTGDASGTQNPLTVTVTTNRTITATFTRRLSLAIQPWPGPTPHRGFLLQLAGAEGNTCLVQTSPDLAAWQPLTTLTISNTAVQFIDVAVTNHSPRFYRGVLR